VLRNVPGELELKRFAEPAERQSYGAQLGRLESSLWRDYDLGHVDAKYALFAPPVGSASRALPALPPPDAAAPLDGAPCRAGDPDARALSPLRSASARATCEYSWSSDGIALPLPPGEPRAMEAGLVLRVEAAYEPPLALAVAVLEDGAGGRQRRWTALSPGATYVPVSLHAGTRALSVVYRVTTRAALAEQSVRIAPAQWRPLPIAGADSAPDRQD
jgi:hypothetical protein